MILFLVGIQPLTAVDRFTEPRLLILHPQHVFQYAVEPTPGSCKSSLPL